MPLTEKELSCLLIGVIGLIYGVIVIVLMFRKE